jgi:hypothetical protein
MDRASWNTHRVEPWHGARRMRQARCAYIWAAILVVVGLLLGSPLSAWAHSNPFPPVSVDQPSQHECQSPPMQLPTDSSEVPAVPWFPLICMAFVLIAVVMTQGMRRWGRVAMFGLVLALGTFTFGTAIHSVHHLSEPQKAAECPVFSASQHVTGTLAEHCDLYAPTLAITRAPHDMYDAPPFTPCFQPAQPRAPPRFHA